MTERLSPQEARCIGLLSEGLMAKEIAYRCGVALATVKNTLHKGYMKLGAETGPQAYRRAIETGQLPCPHGITAPDLGTLEADLRRAADTVAAAR